MRSSRDEARRSNEQTALALRGGGLFCVTMFVQTRCFSALRHRRTRMRGVSCLGLGVAQRRPEGRSAVPSGKQALVQSGPCTLRPSGEPSPCVGAAFFAYNGSVKARVLEACLPRGSAHGRMGRTARVFASQSRPNWDETAPHGPTPSCIIPARRHTVGHDRQNARSGPISWIPQNRR